MATERSAESALVLTRCSGWTGRLTPCGRWFDGRPTRSWPASSSWLGFRIGRRAGSAGSLAAPGF